MSELLKQFRETVAKTISDALANKKKQISRIAMEQKQIEKQQKKMMLEIKMQKAIIQKKNKFQSVTTKNGYFKSIQSTLDLQPFITERQREAIASPEKSINLTNDWKYNSKLLSFFGKQDLRRAKSELKYSPSESKLDAENKQWSYVGKDGGFFDGKNNIHPKDQYIDTRSRFLAASSSRILEKKLWNI